MLDDGTIERYINDYSVTGLTSNPSIFDKAIGSGDYDDAIREKAGAGLSGEDLFFELAIEDLRRAADLFAPIHQRTDGVDGWVSLEVSPLLAYDTTQTVAAAKALHARAGRPNLFIKIPGTPEGLPAITEAIAAGIPVNVTLLFSADHYRAAAEAYLDGVERRVATRARSRGRIGGVGLHVALGRGGGEQGPGGPGGHAGPGRGSRRLPCLPRADALRPRAATAERGGQDPAAAVGQHQDEGPRRLGHALCPRLAAPFTVNTMPDDTLEDFYDHGEVGEPMPEDGGDADALLARFADAGVDTEALAASLQRDGASAFVDSWNELLNRIDEKTTALAG